MAGPLFVGAFSLAGAVRDRYDAHRHSVSSLALGSGGWSQRANFVLTGLLYGAGAVGLAQAPRQAVGSRACPELVAAAALGLIGSGVFVTDPVSGYPPSTSDASVPPGRAAALHHICGVPIFLGIPVAALLSADSFARRRELGWGIYSAATAAVMATTSILASSAFAQNPKLVASGGLLQRTAICAGFGWLKAISIRTRRARSCASDIAHNRNKFGGILNGVDYDTWTRSRLRLPSRERLQPIEGSGKRTALEERQPTKPAAVAASPYRQ